MCFRKKLKVPGLYAAILLICAAFIGAMVPSQSFAQVCHPYTLEKPDVTAQYKSAVTAGVKRYRSLYPEIMKKRYKWEYVEGSEHEITHSCSVTIKRGVPFEVFFKINMRNPANGEVSAIDAQQEILDGRAIRMSIGWRYDSETLYPKPGRPKPAEDLQHCLQNLSKHVGEYKSVPTYTYGDDDPTGYKQVYDPYARVVNYVKNICNFDVVLREKSNLESKNSIRIPKGQEINANERNLWWVYRK